MSNTYHNQFSPLLTDAGTNAPCLLPRLSSCCHRPAVASASCAEAASRTITPLTDAQRRQCSRRMLWQAPRVHAGPGSTRIYTANSVPSRSHSAPYSMLLKICCSRSTSGLEMLVWTWTRCRKLLPCIIGPVWQNSLD